MNHSVYMDYNASAPLRPEARNAMLDALAVHGNPSSVHRQGRMARRIIEDARADVMALVGGDGNEKVIFTSGGTEANQLALAGAGRRRVIAPASEHPAVLEAVKDVIRVGVDANGMVDMDALANAIGEDGSDAIVSVMLANNETGVIQTVNEIAELAHARGALVHCDAVQAAGKMETGFAALGVDYLSISAHKFGGAKGAGALVMRGDAPLNALMPGGGQENAMRGGTENVPGIAAMAAAARAALADLGDEEKRLGAMRDRIEKMALAVDPGALAIGAGAPRLANTSMLVMPGVNRETQVAAMDIAGISLSAGSACASGKSKISPVLAAMGIEESTGSAAIRVSLGFATTGDDIDRFIEVWKETRNRALGAAAPASKNPNAA